MGIAVKAELLSLCRDFIEEKSSTLQSEYSIYRESAANETKSTAGDKHDTSKSMMQLEQEKLGKQLAELQRQKKIVSGIDPLKVCSRVEFGCVIETDNGNFFMSVAAKEFVLNNKTYLAISMQSPLGAAMLNKRVNEDVVYNTKRYKILSIY